MRSLKTNRKGLPLSHREWLPCFFIKQVLHGKIIERKPDRPDKRASAPTALQFYLRRVLFHYRIIYVYGHIGRIGFGVDTDIFRIEKPERADTLLALHDRSLREQVPRFGRKFTVNDIVERTRIPLHSYPINIGLVVFDDTYFQIDRVPFRTYLHRHYLGKKIPVVHIQALYIAAVLGTAQTFGQQLSIIHIPLLNAKDSLQLFGGKFAVAQEFDSTIMVFIPFIHMDINIQGIIPFIPCNGIRNDTCIPET